MDIEKTKEFKNYLQEVISGNAKDVLGSRVVLNTIQSKKITTISGILKIPSDEEIIIFFDDTITMEYVMGRDGGKIQLFCYTGYEIKNTKWAGE